MYHPDHLGTSTFLTDANGVAYQFFLNLPFGETMAEQYPDSYYKTPFKFSGKEMDEETGLHYFGARYYDSRSSIWLSVDPLAEKYPGFNPYNYCMQNPINLVDPDGRDVVPWYVKATLQSCAGDFIRNLATKTFYKAMNDFMSTSSGYKVISQFMKKNQNIYGYSASKDGQFSDYTLNIIEVNIQKVSDRGAFMIDRGSFGVSESSEGKLTFTMYINNSGGRSTESLAETVSHEMLLHGSSIDKIIKIYKEGGIEAVRNYMNSTKEDDHIAVRDNDLDHTGVQEYNKVKKELIKKKPNYKQIFDEAKKRYQENYEGR